MDLPTYFPVEINRRLAGMQDPYKKFLRVVFQDFGIHGNVDVSFTENSACPTFLSKKQHTTLLDRNRLCAQIPTIPLNSTPVSVKLPLVDSVMGETLEMQRKAVKFCSALKACRTSCVQAQKCFRNYNTVQTLLRTLDKMGCYRPKYNPKLKIIQDNMSFGMKEVQCLYQDLSKAPFMQNCNPAFSGGILACLKGDSCSIFEHWLIHADGHHLDTLKLTKVTESGLLLESSDILKTTLDPMYQVDAALVNDKFYVATRHKICCSVLCGQTVADDEEKSSFAQLHLQNFRKGELPASISISPYIPGECMMGTNTGSVYIWKPGIDIQKVISERAHRFQCKDQWRQVHYGSHPRHIIVADRTAVEIFDHRNSFQTGMDLFALPSRLVHSSERIMTTRPHGGNSPYHTVATTHCLFLMDQRFPETPVMQWYPDLLQPLQYLASTDYSTDGTTSSSVALVASQRPAETLCYPFEHGSGRPVTMPLNCWRLSCISDFSQLECLVGTLDPLLTKERFSTSLAGVGVLRGSSPESFITYQVDSYGEIFYQQYGTPMDELTATKACTPGDWGDNFIIPARVKSHLHMWMSQLQENIDKLPNTESDRKCAKVIKLGKGVLKCKSSHSTTCLLCSASLEEAYVSSNTEDDDSGEDIVGMCKNCQILFNHAGDTQQRKSCSSNENLTTLGPVADASFLDRFAPPLDSYPADAAHTQIHLLLARSESLSDEILAKREEEREQLLKERKKKTQDARERRKVKARRKHLNTLANKNDQTSVNHQHQMENAVIDEILDNIQMTQNNFSSEDFTDTDSEIEDDEIEPVKASSETDATCVQIPEKIDDDCDSEINKYSHHSRSRTPSIERMFGHKLDSHSGQATSKSSSHLSPSNIERMEVKLSLVGKPSLDDEPSVSSEKSNNGFSQKDNFEESAPTVSGYLSDDEEFFSGFNFSFLSPSSKSAGKASELNCTKSPTGLSSTALESYQTMIRTPLDASKSTTLSTPDAAIINEPITSIPVSKTPANFQNTSVNHTPVSKTPLSLRNISVSNDPMSKAIVTLRNTPHTSTPIPDTHVSKASILKTPEHISLSNISVSDRDISLSGTLVSERKTSLSVPRMPALEKSTSFSLITSAETDPTQSLQKKISSKNIAESSLKQSPDCFKTNVRSLSSKKRLNFQSKSQSPLVPENDQSQISGKLPDSRLQTQPDTVAPLFHHAHTPSDTSEHFRQHFELPTCGVVKNSRHSFGSYTSAPSRHISQTTGPLTGTASQPLRHNIGSTGAATGHFQQSIGSPTKTVSGHFNPNLKSQKRKLQSPETGSSTKKKKIFISGF